MILIKAAKIIDGTGKPPFKADVLIKNDKISAIGSFANKKADIVIDGLGQYLTPGFIDANTDSDHYLTLFTYPEQTDFLTQGVTTIIGGQCGSSLAPLIYGSLESIRKWADPNQINVNWHSVREFLETLARLKFGVNFGTLAGHSTIRRALIGEDLRNLTASELTVFQNTLKKALEEGALGFSTGLGYAHSRQTPLSEIKSLAKLTAQANGVYTTHLRDEKDGLMASINETAEVAREAGVKTVINHLRPVLHANFKKENFLQALQIIEDTAQNADIYFNTYPFDTSIVPIYTLLPEWAQNGGLEVMTDNITAPAVAPKIIAELPPLAPDSLTIMYAPGNEYLVGTTLGQFAANRGLALPSALLKLMVITNLRAVVFYKNVQPDLVMENIFHPRALIASNSASSPAHANTLKHERAYKTFTHFLQLVKERNILPLEKAIAKITALPAKLFGLKNLGLIKEGYFADLVLLKETEATSVLVSGQLAIKNKARQNILAGKILKRS